MEKMNEVNILLNKALDILIAMTKQEKKIGGSNFIPLSQICVSLSDVIYQITLLVR